MQRIDNSRVSLGYLNQIDDRLVFDAQHNQRHYLNIHFLLKQTKKDIYIYIYIFVSLSQLSKLFGAICLIIILFVNLAQ